MLLTWILIGTFCFSSPTERYNLAIVDFTHPVKETNRYGQQGPKELRADKAVEILMVNLGQYLQSDFQLVERDKVQLIFEEQTLVESNKLDPETAARLGKMTGAEYLLTGMMTELNSDSKVFSGYDIGTKTTTCRMAVTFRLLHTTTGEVFAVGEADAEKRYRGDPSMDTYLRDLTRIISRKVSDQSGKFFKMYRDAAN